MTKKHYRDDSVSAVMMNDGGKVFLIEMTLWRDHYKCDRFKKFASQYNADGSFGFSIVTLLDDLNGLGTHEKEMHEIWITEMYPKLKGMILFSVAQMGKDTFNATVVEKEYYAEEYSGYEIDDDWKGNEYDATLRLE